MRSLCQWRRERQWLNKKDIRNAVLESIASIAPEADLKRISATRALREQIDLDSLDWLNVFEALQARLSIRIPPAEQGRITSLDELVGYLAGQARLPATAAVRDDAPEALPRAQWIVDGRTITVRPIGPDDAQLESEFVRHLSVESRYKRFMSTIVELPSRKLAELTDVDQESHVALVATAEVDGGVSIVGVARYIVEPPGRSCEFAITVDDAWQGTGLAGLLMQLLIDVARSRGLATMEGEVLRSNRPMLRFARQLGFAPQARTDDRETVHIVRAL